MYAKHDSMMPGVLYYDSDRQDTDDIKVEVTAS